MYQPQQTLKFSKLSAFASTGRGGPGPDSFLIRSTASSNHSKYSRICVVLSQQHSGQARSLFLFVLKMQELGSASFWQFLALGLVHLSFRYTELLSSSWRFPDRFVQSRTIQYLGRRTGCLLMSKRLSFTYQMRLRAGLTAETPKP